VLGLNPNDVRRLAVLFSDHQAIAAVENRNAGVPEFNEHVLNRLAADLQQFGIFGQRQDGIGNGLADGGGDEALSLRGKPPSGPG
jgi:hypothetical protein